MFSGIGFGEMIIIAGVALVVIGPEKFPEFAKIVIRTVRDLRGYVDDAKRDIANELRPVKQELDDLSKYQPDALASTVTESLYSEYIDDNDDDDIEVDDTQSFGDPYRSAGGDLHETSQDDEASSPDDNSEATEPATEEEPEQASESTEPEKPTED